MESFELPQGPSANIIDSELCGENTFNVTLQGGGSMISRRGDSIIVPPAAGPRRTESEVNFIQAHSLFFMGRILMVFNDFSSDEEGSLSITADKRSHPDSQAGSTSQARRSQRRTQLWKIKPVKEEEEEREERGEEVGLEGEGEESRDNDYEDEDFGKCPCTVTCTAHHNKYTR